MTNTSTEPNVTEKKMGERVVPVQRGRKLTAGSDLRPAMPTPPPAAPLGHEPVRRQHPQRRAHEDTPFLTRIWPRNHFRFPLLQISPLLLSCLFAVRFWTQIRTGDGDGAGERRAELSTRLQNDKSNQTLFGVGTGEWFDLLFFFSFFFFGFWRSFFLFFFFFFGFWRWSLAPVLLDWGISLFWLPLGLVESHPQL